MRAFWSLFSYVLYILGRKSITNSANVYFLLIDILENVGSHQNKSVIIDFWTDWLTVLVRLRRAVPNQNFGWGTILFLFFLWKFKLQVGVCWFFQIYFIDKPYCLNFFNFTFLIDQRNTGNFQSKFGTVLEIYGFNDLHVLIEDKNIKRQKWLRLNSLLSFPRFLLVPIIFAQLTSFIFWRLIMFFSDI